MSLYWRETDSAASKLSVIVSAKTMEHTWCSFRSLPGHAEGSWTNKCPCLKNCSDSYVATSLEACKDQVYLWWTAAWDRAKNQKVSSNQEVPGEISARPPPSICPPQKRSHWLYTRWDWRTQRGVSNHHQKPSHWGEWTPGVSAWSLIWTAVLQPGSLNMVVWMEQSGSSRCGKRLKPNGAREENK